MLDPLAFALTSEGAAVCGKALLELLARFEGRQLATFGTSGIPLMQAAIAQGRGRYHGLVIRKERKGHGARRQVEGPIQPMEPVILIDDTVSSGGSLEAARAALEEEGLFVEGAAVLVQFHWAGAARLRERGWHLESVLELERDLAPEVEGVPPPPANPLLPSEALPWSEDPAPDGLTPAALARRYLEHLLESGTLLRPPEALDRQHDARGGAIVSLRSGPGLLQRHLRSGLWRHPGDAGHPAGHEIALACWKALRQLPPGAQGAQLLARSRIGVTLFGPLRAAHLGEVDHRRDGLVLISQARPGAQSSALPNLPGISSAAEQLLHARTMGGLALGEPVRMFRHRVTKHVEDPGWPVGGAPDLLDAWTRRPLGAKWTHAARERLLARKEGQPASSSLRLPRLPAGVDYVFLTLFVDGVAGACVGAMPTSPPGAMLDRLITRALADGRSAPLATDSRIAVELSFLYARQDTGPLGFGEAARHVRAGCDAVGVVQGEASAIVLPALAVHEALSAEALLQVVLGKAGIVREPASFQLWRTASWLDDGERVWPVAGAFPSQAPAADPSALADKLRALLTGYLVRNVEPDGRLPARYDPIADRLVDEDDLERACFVAWSLARRAHTDPDAAGAVARLLTRLEAQTDLLLQRGPSGPAMLLCALTESGAEPKRWSALQAALARHPLDGGMETGHVLVALAQARARGAEVDVGRVRAGLWRLRHTFRHHPRMRQAVLPWAALAHSAWASFGERGSAVAFVHEAAASARSLQSADGGFQTDTQVDAPGCTSAPLLEALAASLALAPRHEDRAAFEKGLSFLDGLVYQERDAGVLPNPGFAEGGVRFSQRRATVRIDFVAHALNALTM